MTALAGGLRDNGRGSRVGGPGDSSWPALAARRHATRRAPGSRRVQPAGPAGFNRARAGHQLQKVCWSCSWEAIFLLERLSAANGSLADEADRVLELALPPLASSAHVARDELRSYCRRRDVPPTLVDDCVLVISELVTNAVVHGRTPFMAWAEYDGVELTVAVQDGEASQPVQLRPLDDGTHESGRGVAIVDGLGATWGSMPTALGKIVWARLTDRTPRVPPQR